MKRKIASILVILLLTTFMSCTEKSQPVKKVYEPTFESLETSNPVPEWFKDAKFGIYFHWGVYATPAFANEWYPRNMFIKGSNENKHHTEVYGDPAEWPYNNFITGANDKQGNFVQFAPKLKSEGGKFDPDEWAQLFADAGAKFAGPVAEHHDGFSMWASEVNPWNAKDKGPKLDLVGLLANSIRQKDMKLILSMHHAYNITGYYDAVPPTDDPELQKLYAQLGKEKNEAVWLEKHKEIIDNYQPDIIWQDFNLHRISQPVLLGFLSYYYNKAGEWNKEVVATFKDGLNSKCGVLDYERGGATDITDYYWLTDDAISQTSWCYTEGLKYYSTKQILHGFLDRISKNGNLLLNISPMADGSIPQGQKDILLGMGSWLKKYGEAAYATRAWVKYGEGPTAIGRGTFTSPAEGTSKDFRFTRSKDNKTLYAIFFGWEKDQKELLITSLTSNRINLKNLKSVELINGAAGQYLPLKFNQTAEGLTIGLPEKTLDDMAYVLKLKFKGEIPALDQSVDLDCNPHYYLVPGQRPGNLVLNTSLAVAEKRNEPAFQWKMENAGKGFYRILSRENNQKAMACTEDGKVEMADAATGDNQVWKMESSYFGLIKITNKQYPDYMLAVNGTPAADSLAVVNNMAKGAPFFGWQLKEVCELKVMAFKPLAIPGTIEAEDFNSGCPGEAYSDRDEANTGGQYRTTEGVDIEICEAGGFDVSRTSTGEWMTYTADVAKAGVYQVSFFVATTFDNAKLKLECPGNGQSVEVALPNTKGRQAWKEEKGSLKLDSGQTTLKLSVMGRGINIDKMVFKAK